MSTQIAKPSQAAGPASAATPAATATQAPTYAQVVSRLQADAPARVAVSEPAEVIVSRSIAAQVALGEHLAAKRGALAASAAPISPYETDLPVFVSAGRQRVVVAAVTVAILPVLLALLTVAYLLEYWAG